MFDTKETATLAYEIARKALCSIKLPDGKGPENVAAAEAAFNRVRKTVFETGKEQGPSTPWKSIEGEMKCQGK